MSMICRVCGGRFDDEELSLTREYRPYADGVALETMGYDCPDCGALLTREGRCRECGEEVPRCELEEGLCRLCVEETRESLEWMWGMLSPCQQGWAAVHDEWMAVND